MVELAAVFLVIGSPCHRRLLDQQGLPPWLRKSARGWHHHQRLGMKWTSQVFLHRKLWCMRPIKAHTHFGMNPLRETLSSSISSPEALAHGVAVSVSISVDLNEQACNAITVAIARKGSRQLPARYLRTVNFLYLLG